MGVAGMVVATLAGGLFQANAQKKAYEAQAQQAEAQSRQLQLNADKLQETAERQDQANKINEENQRRIRMAKLGQQRAAIGASGITASGSAANALMDSNEAMEREAAIESYNNRQKVESIFQDQTNLMNQAAQYDAQASNYRKAGKQAFKNTLIQTGFSLAANLYSPKSAANQSSTGGSNAWGSAMNDISQEFQGGIIPSSNWISKNSITSWDLGKK